MASLTKEVIVSPERPTVLIGERLNPTGKKKLANALMAGDFEYLKQEAISQVEEGADVLDVNVGIPGLDEIELMVKAVEAIMKVVDVPLCFDSQSPQTIEAALSVYKGKALINSVNAEEKSLDAMLPLVKKHGAAVVALPMDEKGIPNAPGGRLALAHKIVGRADSLGIGREDIIFDALAMSVGADGKAGRATLETIHLIKAELGTNQTLGVSNVSFGVPDRDLVNSAFLAMAIAAGVNCPVVDVGKIRNMVFATDLALGLDEYARRYVRAFRDRQKSGA